MNQVFTRTVDRYPDRTAVVDPTADLEYTYEELDERVSSVATALAELGIDRGDRVGVIMRNRIELVSIFWASQSLGAAFVPFNFRTATDELAFVIDNAEIDVLFFSESTRNEVMGAYGKTDVDQLVYVDRNPPDPAETYEEFLTRGDSAAFPQVDIPSDETSLILHTSGTTGRPKGVPRSQLNTYMATTAHAIQQQWVEGETALVVMPTFHTVGLHTVTTVAMLSGKLVLQRYSDPAQSLELIETENVSCLYLVPTIYSNLLEAENIDNTDLSSIRKVSYVGMPMTASLEQKVRDEFDPDVFVNHYGSSEVYFHSACNWLDKKSGCAGRAGINTRVRVVEASEEGTVSPARVVADGEMGEIIVDASSPEAFDGYLNRPDANKESFKDGWYFTGDLGYRDEDGDLFVVGRVDDMIITGGENVYPTELEDVLAAHDAVTEVAVVGLEDEQWGQIITAFIRTTDSDPDFHALTEKIDEYCLESDDVADFKRPRRYVYVDSLPKSNVGKVLKRELEGDAPKSTVYADIQL